MDIEQNSFELLLNSKSFLIPSMFDRLTKVSRKVYHQLIFNSSHQYIIESNVSEEVLNSYIKYWINNEIPDITINNFYEYSSLSHEFGLLIELVEEKKKEFGKDLEFYKGLTDPNNIYQSEYIEQVTKNLDQYLENYGVEMMKLPIKILYNIFNHQNRKLTNHNLAYDLIQIGYKRSNDSEIFILLPCLDGTKISQENLEDAIRSSHSRCGFMPKIDGTCLYTALEKQRTMEKQMGELQDLINNQNSKMENFMIEFSAIKNNQNKEIENLKQIIKNQANEISSYKDLNDKNFSNIIQYIKDHVTEIKDYNQKNDSNINNIIQLTKKQANELLDYEQKTDKSINEFSQITKEQATKIKLLEENQEKKIVEINESKIKIDDAIKKQNDRVLKIQAKFEDLLNLIASRSKNKKEQNQKSQNNSPSQDNSSTTKTNQNKITSTSNNHNKDIENSYQNIGAQNADLMNKESLNQKQNIYPPRISQQQQNISSPKNVSSVNNQNKISPPTYYDSSFVPTINIQDINPLNSPNKKINARVNLHVKDPLSQYQQYYSPRLNQRDYEISPQNNSYMSYESYSDQKNQSIDYKNLYSIDNPKNFNFSSDSDDMIFPISNKSNSGIQDSNENPKSFNLFNPSRSPQFHEMNNDESSSDQYSDHIQNDDPNNLQMKKPKSGKKRIRKKIGKKKV